jgi:hypothetical protein
MKWILILLLCGATTPAFTKGRKGSCPSRDLKRQDCRLQDESYNVRLLAETVAWFDGTWHTVEEMPLKGKQSSWEKARFEVHQGWPVLQLWLWDNGEGEGQVQSLHWLTVSLMDRKFTVLAQGIVRKRRPKGDAPADKPSYLYDAWQPHSAKMLKNGTIEWELNGRKKNLKRSDYGL